ncbi:MAG: hypothetical protein LBG15_15390 [Dysgonamonadaceae bacterium]|jgi:hypothetical protein|nr:hypothetical protein [Dysgonamonadaceae bacterium]
MKTTKFYILLISILLSTQMFATHTTFKERSDNWLKQNENNEKRPGIDDDTPPEAPEAPYDDPIGDALVPLLSFALIYGVYRCARKESFLWRR